MLDAWSVEIKRAGQCWQGMAPRPEHKNTRRQGFESTLRTHNLCPERVAGGELQRQCLAEEAPDLGRPCGRALRGWGPEGSQTTTTTWGAPSGESPQGRAGRAHAKQSGDTVRCKS